MKFEVTKTRDGQYRYQLTIGKSKWGLKKHYMNSQYYFAVPMNTRSKNHASGLRGVWFSRDYTGKWNQTKSPAVWVGE